jgi:hypothetical protein
MHFRNPQVALNYPMPGTVDRFYASEQLYHKRRQSV